jgi:hypothetical protein
MKDEYSGSGRLSLDRRMMQRHVATAPSHRFVFVPVNRLIIKYIVAEAAGVEDVWGHNRPYILCFQPGTRWRMVVSSKFLHKTCTKYKGSTPVRQYTSHSRLEASSENQARPRDGLYRS